MGDTENETSLRIHRNHDHAQTFTPQLVPTNGVQLTDFLSQICPAA